jgi:hypothetical protein
MGLMKAKVRMHKVNRPSSKDISLLINSVIQIPNRKENPLSIRVKPYLKRELRGKERV